MSIIRRIGFGQVEPNHLSAQRTGQIYAQLPVAANIKVLENGQYVKYDYANNEVNYTGEGEWMLVFNEVKLYDTWRESYKDFALQAKDYTPGESNIPNGVPFKLKMVPRVFKTNIGDIYTTNCVGGPNTDGKAEYAGIDLMLGDVLSPNPNGYLVKNENGDMKWQVVKVYTMPDGQSAVKLMRIA